MGFFGRVTKVVRAVFDRLGYLALLRHPGVLRWLVDAVDYVIVDHVQPMAVVKRSPRSLIHPSVCFREAQNVHLGTDTRVQPNCVLWASPNSKIVVGDQTGLGPGTMIFSSNHRFALGEPYHKQPWTEATVTIGRDVWVGAGCIILPGVTIGDCCVVAAGSVVTKDIPSNSLAGGVPARVIRQRDPAAMPVRELPGLVDVDA